MFESTMRMQAIYRALGPAGERVLAAALLALALFAVIAATSLRSVGLSADAASAWATPAPHRTVLCVQDGDPPRETVAAEPTDLDRASQRARLDSSERRLPLGPLTIHVREHTYRATLEGFGLSLPWMKNDYTAAWPDVPAHLAWSLSGSPRAGQAVHLGLGGLVLLLASLLAGRLGGPLAALVTGVWLASDPWFHMYKRELGGPEVFLQLFAVLGLLLLAAAALRRSRRALLLACLVLGLGLHVKPTFFALVAGAGLGAVAVTWGARPSRRLLATAALVLGLGFAPTAGFWALQAGLSPPGIAAQGQENALHRIRDLATPVPQADRSDPKKSTTALDAVLDPARFWERHYIMRGAIIERHPPNVPAPPRGPLRWAAMLGTLGLLLLAAFSGRALAKEGMEGAPMGERRLLLGLVLIAVVMVPVLRLLNPDPHHLALWLPVFATAVGALLGALSTQPRLRTAVLVLLIAMTLGRVASLHDIDASLEQYAGRMSTADGQRRVAEALARNGATSPAFLAYDVMSLPEAWTGGAVRPWQYSRASIGAGPDCLRGDDPRFLQQVLRAHRGGHFVLVATPSSGPGGRPSSDRTEEQVQEAARAVGLTASPLERVKDAQGRWLATLWAVRGR